MAAKKRHKVGGAKRRKRFKGVSRDVLEQMARDIVGDGKTPNVFFVSEANGGAVAVALSRDAAMGAAKALGESKAILVEDRLSGEVWGNRTYELSQMADDDE